ncbi:MAG: hypothetical protein GY953_04550, partial [bacterium]|nr:hypothetical protein [bacterium]
EMGLKERVQFGRTGLMVSRIGLASGYGVPTAAIEKAFHEYGVNYFFLSLLKRGNMVQAIRNLAPQHRDEMCVVAAKPTLFGAFSASAGGFSLQGFVDRWCRKLGLERVELIVLQDLRKPPSRKLVERVNRLRDTGRARFVGLSSHNRPLLGGIASGAVKAPVDFLQVRYNAVHPGA